MTTTNTTTDTSTKDPGPASMRQMHALHREMVRHLLLRFRNAEGTKKVPLELISATGAFLRDSKVGFTPDRRSEASLRKIRAQYLKHLEAKVNGPSPSATLLAEAG